jgi:putative iron-dependent peroxidase
VPGDTVVVISSQFGILAPVPNHSRNLEFGAVPGGDLISVLRDFASRTISQSIVIGLGPGLIKGLGCSIEELRPFPALSGPGCEVPSTQADLWCWVRGDDRGAIVHQARSVTHGLRQAFSPVRVVDGFKYDRGLDLTGYEDGTENPAGDDAVDAAIVQGAGSALDGSSFVAVQQWVHDLDRFNAKAQGERDNIIGRRLSDNEELDEAPVSAHVKRTAQESFDPEAFVVRRSMPWANADGEGLMFVAFGKSLDPFEAQLRRMTGQEDGVIDGLFSFTRAVSGSYFWCPPVSGERLDLTALGI